MIQLSLPLTCCSHTDWLNWPDFSQNVSTLLHLIRITTCMSIITLRTTWSSSGSEIQALTRIWLKTSSHFKSHLLSAPVSEQLFLLGSHQLLSVWFSHAELYDVFWGPWCKRMTALRLAVWCLQWATVKARCYSCFSWFRAIFTQEKNCLFLMH